MSKNTESLISQLLDAARAAGADGADAGMSRSEGTSVTVRLGKVESSERSEDIGAALRVFVGKRNASVSTSWWIRMRCACRQRPAARRRYPRTVRMIQPCQGGP